MNKVVGKFLKLGDKFMPELHLQQPGLGKYAACAPFTKISKESKNFWRLQIQIIYTKNGLDKVCFQHDIAYGDFKDLKRRTQSDKVLKNKAFEIASNPIYDGYQRGLASVVYEYFDKKSKESGIKNEIKEQYLGL